VTRRGWMLFTLMGVIWGTPYLLIRVADGGVSVPVLVFARTGMGALVLLPLALPPPRAWCCAAQVLARPQQPARLRQG